MRACLLLAASILACHAQAPTPDVLKQVLTKRLLSLRPEGYSERQVLFQSVTPAPKKGAFYPFTVTALIRDYGPGYPANKFYGETCVGKMDNWVFNLSPGANGEWAGCDICASAGEAMPAIANATPQTGALNLKFILILRAASMRRCAAWRN